VKTKEKSIIAAIKMVLEQKTYFNPSAMAGI